MEMAEGKQTECSKFLLKSNDGLWNSPNTIQFNTTLSLLSLSLSLSLSLLNIIILMLKSKQNEKEEEREGLASRPPVPLA